MPMKHYNKKCEVQNADLKVRETQGQITVG